MKTQTIHTFIIFIFLQLIFFSCKNQEIINLEAAIDEYLYLEKQAPLNVNNIEILKSNFEKLDPESLNEEQKVSRLYYMSEIALIQNKPKEAYAFISKAYMINHADSIYKQREKINNIAMDAKISNIDSINTNIVWVNDLDNNLLMFDLNKTHYNNNKTEKIDDANLKINKIMNKGREEVQSLYKNKKYEAAINKAQMLIMIVNELNINQTLNIELSQLYQDLSILYAKQNLLDLAKETIKKALKLNPSDKNKEINNLLIK